MFAMLFSSITSMVQAGFVIGIGLLVDTFIVRTITVPALAVLIGKANWWPSGWRPKGRAPRLRSRLVPKPGGDRTTRRWPSFPRPSFPKRWLRRS
jgi:RND superfamily putative drug exporter